ncbi:MAG: hypothetical protein OXG53_02300 [Chloroflexi bacterium]|nr:hypothetical protein [Chloroflexota bacterium]
MKRALIATIMVVMMITVPAVLLGQSTLAKPVLRAERTGADVTVTWEAVENAVRYQFYVYHASTGWVQLGGTNLTETRVVHEMPTAGLSYYYTGRAVGADGSFSPWGDYVQVSIPLNPTPTPTQVPSDSPPCSIVHTINGDDIQLQPQTLSAFASQFGESPDDPNMHAAILYPSTGILKVGYLESIPGSGYGDYVIIWEKWNGCQFLGVEFELDEPTPHAAVANIPAITTSHRF